MFEIPKRARSPETQQKLIKCDILLNKLNRSDGNGWKIIGIVKMI